MKIAYILNTYPQPSQSFIRREIRALEAAGHDVYRLAMRKPDVRLVDAQDRAEADKTEYVLAAGTMALLGSLLHALRRDPAAFWDALKLALRMGKVSEVGRLRHLIYLAEAAHVAERARADDLLHSHAHFGTNAATVALLSHILGGPGFSFTVHGPEEFDAPRALSLRDKIHHAAFTVAVSQFGRAQLCRWADHPDWDRIKVIHCGIEPSKFATPALMPTGPRRLVAIGRLVEQKGQLALVAAMAHSKSDLHLTLIGDGEMRGEIETLIARQGLTDRITLTGWVDEARISQELAQAHALVMPSFAEGLPMVVMETMAAARPVIATYIAGTPELVQPGKTGWLVPAGDVMAMAEALDTFAQTPEATLAQMGRAARTRVMDRHDITTEAAKLAQAMSDALYSAPP